MTIQKLQFAKINDVAPLAMGVGTHTTIAQDVGGLQLIGLQMPSAWDVAGICFDVSYDGTNFGPLSTTTGEVVIADTVALGDSRWITFANTRLFFGVQSVKVLSGTHAAPVNQTAGRLFNLAFAKDV